MATSGYTIKMPGKLWVAAAAIGATEFLSQGAVDAWAGATEKRYGQGVQRQVLGSRSVVAEILAMLRELLDEVDEGKWPARDLCVERGDLARVASQVMERA